MAATREEIAALVAEMDLGRQAWISGRLETTATTHFVQDPAMTIFGPFGGLGRGGPELDARQAQTVQLFQGGSGSCELVESFASGDLVVLVMIERNTVTFAGETAPRPWVLRTTQVFRRDGARWLRLHRHADPLMSVRPLAATLALAGE